MIELPYDIWPLIASFLSEDELWVIRGLNKALFNIALDKRYRLVKVDLNRPPSGEYARSFIHLYDENVAKRVHEIDYRQTFNFMAMRDNRLPKLRNNFFSFKQRFQGTSEKKAMINAISRFTNVSAIRIYSPVLPTKNFDQWKPILHAGFGAHSENIRSLSLAFPFKMLADIIPATITFPRLETLAITLQTPFSQTQDLDSMFSTAAITMILPFVNRHRLSLHSIDFRLQPSRAQSMESLFSPDISFSLTPLLKGLNHVPQLESASFSVSGTTGSSDVSQFLKFHSDTLRHLSLSFTGNVTFSTDHIFGDIQAPLRHLESFSIDYQNYSKDAITNNPIMKFIHRHSSSLTSLKIFDKFHFRAELLELLSPAHETLAFHSRLKHLNVEVHSLTPDIVDMISSRLLNLEDLELRVHWFKRRDTSTHNEEYEFCLEMNRRSYPDWQLKHLIVKRMDERSRELGPHYCITAMAEALLSLQTFNGMSRSKYLAGARSVTSGVAKQDRLPWDAT